MRKPKHRENSNEVLESGNLAAGISPEAAQKLAAKMKDASAGGQAIFGKWSAKSAVAEEDEQLQAVSSKLRGELRLNVRRWLDGKGFGRLGTEDHFNISFDEPIRLTIFKLFAECGFDKIFEEEGRAVFFSDTGDLIESLRTSDVTNSWTIRLFRGYNRSAYNLGLSEIVKLFADKRNLSEPIRGKISELFAASGIEDQLRDKFERAVLRLIDNPDLADLLSDVGPRPSNVGSTKLPHEPPKYAYQPRQPGGIVAYLEDNWGDLIRSGAFTRPDLLRIDPAGYQALSNWLRKNELPASLPLLKKSDVVDRELGAVSADERRRMFRLRSATARRAKPTDP